MNALKSSTPTKGEKKIKQITKSERFVHKENEWRKFINIWLNPLARNLSALIEIYSAFGIGAPNKVLARLAITLVGLFYVLWKKVFERIQLAGMGITFQEENCSCLELTD